MIEQARPEVLQLGAKKRKLQRACDTCRRRKGRPYIYTEETSGLISIPRTSRAVRCAFASTLLPSQTDRYLAICCCIPALFFETGDGPSKPANRCTNCVTGNHSCTYVESKPVGTLIIPLFHQP